MGLTTTYTMKSIEGSFHENNKNQRLARLFSIDSMWWWQRLAATRVAEAVAVAMVARAVPVVVAPLIAFSLALAWHPKLFRTPCRRVLEVRRLLVPRGAEDGGALATAAARVQPGIIPL